jgi:hypothetical protein
LACREVSNLTAEREPEDESLASPDNALAFWRDLQSSEEPDKPGNIYFAFETANHLRAERLATYLRETNPYPIEIHDHTKIGHDTDSWWVQGQTPDQVLTKEFVEVLFRWLCVTESRLGIRLSAISS